MAFNSGFGSPAPAAGGSNVQTGPDLEDIQTEGLGFLALSGESKVQLLPSAWPSDRLPPPTASLMSIASQKGLVAAAGPDALIVATTDSVRKAFEGAVSGDGNLKPFTPQLTIPMPMRISQVVFSADESCLVLSAETGGGLAVYDVQALLNGSTQSAFELSTNGTSLRALVPNPTPEKGELLALITNDGNLMMANLKERSLITGPNGQVLKDGVSCLSWSTRGKQLVAGLGNGTAYQMTPEGEVKAEIPRPPNVSANDHVSSISWLENNVFLMVHTPSQFDQAPPSTFHIVTRQPPSSFMFQKISDPTQPFGLNRSPPHHFVLRLKDFPPTLQDVLIVASSASTDIGLLTRCQVPLTKDKPADKISGVFTMTEMASDSRRAQLPLSQELGDTSPIGFALDLSSKETVFKPIPGDEIDESSAPAPSLMVLTNEGALASWWVIYSDSIRQNTVYPGLTVAGGASQPLKQQSPAPSTTPSAPFSGPAKTAFGTSNFGQPAFGAAKPAGAFGTSSPMGPATGAFGAASSLGKSQSPWATASASTATSTGGATFGSSTFGSAPAPQASAPAFGAPSFGAPSMGLGARPSPWTTGGSTAPVAAFGQAGGLGKPASPFAAASQSTPSAPPAGTGFSSFAAGGGFAAATAAPGSTGSIFGAKPAANPFASSKTETSGIFGQPSTDSKPAAAPFGSSFVLGSTFKADNAAKDEVSEKSNELKGSFFGVNFGNALGEVAKAPAQTPVSQETDMDSEDTVKPSVIPKIESTTPFSSPAPKASLLATKPSTTSGLFGIPPAPTPAANKPISTGFNFGQPTADRVTSGDFSFSKLDKGTSPVPQTPITHEPSLPASQTPASPKIKQEPRSGETTPVDKGIPEAPLPPESTSKATYGAGESTGSSTVTDAPLPQDFIPKAASKPPPAPPSKETSEKPMPSYMIPPTDVSGGPQDDGNESGFVTEEGSDDEGPSEESEEGSGEDVAKDLSPVSESNQTPGFTPESSFGGPKTRIPEGNIFSKPADKALDKKKGSLFGEFKAPNLPPPKVQASPRSPSPVRNAIPGRILRPDASRSVSAPGVASQILGSQRLGGKSASPSKSTYVISKEEQDAEQKRRDATKAEQEAEETRALINEDDERMQRDLAADIAPTTTLDEFIAHSNYSGFASIESIPAQVEAVYRDINSMIDTLGLNARSLKSFVQGHEDVRDEPRSREDLENDGDWCLVEVENLSVIVERELGRELEQGRIKDVAEKLEACNDLQKDLIRLRAKHDDVRKIISLQRDPGHLANSRAQPLGAEQIAQQNDLRRDFKKFLQLLSEAEDGISVLKAKIVSQATSAGKANGSAGPTVEAVMRTISKMTTMAEKRSGDIDVLEGQMRRLRFGSPAVGSREGSPFATPQNNRSSLRQTTSSSYGLFYTPDSIKDTNQRLLQSSIMSSNSSFGRSSPGPRKKLSGYTAEEKAQLKTKLARKKAVTGKLRDALGKAGTNVRLMGDDD